MREAHGAADTETAAAVVGSKDTAVAAVDGDKRTAAASRTRVVAAVVVCSREPRH